MEAHKRINNFVKKLASKNQKLVKRKQEILNEYFYLRDNDPQNPKLKTLEEQILSIFIKMLGQISWKFITQYKIPEKYQEDIFQETLLSFKKALIGFKQEYGNNFSTYLYRICVNNLKKSLINKFHLVKNKSFNNITEKNKNQLKKFQFVSLDNEEIQDFLYYMIEDDIPEQFDIELFERILKDIKNQAPKLYKILIKKLKGEKLSKKERDYFNKKRNSLAIYIKEKYNISSIEDFKF